MMILLLKIAFLEVAGMDGLMFPVGFLFLVGVGISC